MMKKFKKLIPAICLLLVSVTLLGGTTFAWFSMNNKVTATGMQITAKSNTKFLVISSSVPTAAADSLGTATSTDVSSTKKGGIGGTTTNVYPVRYNSTGSALTDYYNADVTGKTQLSIGDGTWFTAFSTDLFKVTGEETTGSDTKKYVTGYKTIENSYAPETPVLGDTKTYLDEYVLKYTCYVGLAQGSADHKNKLTVDVNFGEGASSAFCALVVVTPVTATISDTGVTTANGTEEKIAFDNLGNKNGKQTAGDIELSGVTKYVKAEIYLYVDGGDSDIVSLTKDTEGNNVAFAGLTGNVTVSFTMAGITD